MADTDLIELRGLRVLGLCGLLPEEQARQAVTAAVERLDHGRTTPQEIVLAPRLVVRGTTARPR